MSELVNQPSRMPTRKLNAAMLGAFTVSLLAVIVRNVAPGYDDPDLWLALSPVTVAVFGYFTRERAT